MFLYTSLFIVDVLIYEMNLFPSKWHKNQVPLFFFLGLGSSLVESLRDEYPLAYLLSILVAPFQQGETPLQHYNSLFCLSWVQRYCDAALLFNNDSVLEQILKQGPTMAQRDQGFSMLDMNDSISKCLCNTFLPLQNSKSRSAYCMLVATFL